MKRRDLTLPAKVGARMQAVRVARGLSLRWIHAHGGPTPFELSAIERGKVDFTVRTLDRVATILGVRAWQLLAVDEPDLATMTLDDARRLLFIEGRGGG
jgi:hypothetical protein